jgi:hypothetical protein
MSDKNNQLPDDLNPEFLFNGTANKLLSQIIKGQIDPVLLAKQQLANRGLDSEGKWIGFTKAKKHHGLL